MQPAHGARMTLRLTSRSDHTVAYAVEIETSERTHVASAEVRLADGELVLSAFSPADPPAWAVEHVRALLRGEWRAKAWPRRVTRWREERGKVEP